ncbi:FAD-dependent oxidoreductase [Amycolatopsis sp. cmx-4-83]|uniref:FAD-dependent oxidoreductase n=1 Tax=Amycolatopsis sp. cmx-4-83 TaxID=2790940 RepID=UPI00397BFF84
MTDAEDPRVLVCGGGPSGLLVAGTVAAAGIATTVVEASAAPPAGLRASTLHARSMEVLDELGVPGLGGLPRSSRGHYVGLPLDLGGAPSRWAGSWRCAQPDLVRRLTRWALLRGVRLLRGERVRSVVQRPTHVIATTTEERRLVGEVLVGADGADSDVRAMAGIAVDGPDPRRCLVRADVLGGGLRPRRFERIGDLTVTCAPIAGRTSRVMVHDPSWPVGQEVGAGTLRATWRAVTGEDLPSAIDWIDTFADRTGVAERATAGRVVLCGDAAHQFIPIGGVALNSAIIGAHAVAQRIIEFCRGDGDALGRYSLQSTGRARETAARLRNEARLLFDVSAGTRAERAGIAARLDDDERFHDQVVRTIAGIESGTRGKAVPR